MDRLFKRVNLHMTGARILLLAITLSFSACNQFSKKSDSGTEEEIVTEEVSTDTPAAEEDTTQDAVPSEGMLWTRYDESGELEANAEHPIARMRYKLIQSKVLDKNEVFMPLYPEVGKMAQTEYERLKPQIMGRTIPEVQSAVKSGAFSYEDLTRFFLYRIYAFELDNRTTLNTIIALNADVIREAKRKDSALKASPGMERHPIFGMPILLKDNINTAGMHTTAGAIALMNNQTDDAYIVERLKERGALILGKVNLSEWAYYMCSGCPVGYSAVGGQTLNPYGRRAFETGGSSSGSGTAMAAGYAMGAVGTETSGSILSPSSQNSIVGLKPKVGMLSRNGIVPISSTLDTPGPMTRSVTDAAILMDAMLGYDILDPVAFNVNWGADWYLKPTPNAIGGLRLGVFESLMESDQLYRSTVENLKKAGAKIIPFKAPEVEREGFLTLLNLDMRKDLPEYLNTQIRDTTEVTVRSVADVVAFNNADPELRIPYGQKLLEGIVADTTSEEAFLKIRKALLDGGRQFFDEPWEAHQLDGILSVNNLHAGYAATARNPALTIPMGYRESGEPAGLTIIVRGFQVPLAFQLAYAIEAIQPARKAPEGYE
ncbi:amidase family protein [Robiginitalea aurantiaca]|uniref:Amidase family protein n=1 Tax=Robiginitalea aurantiaca TaxID=3056915 RepID=A0ABT7WGH4_9FLAO|nr:amidase family protein [Robiginitalea aurantiaca]MDM9632024.1 amidase family protein [Robiginitalea aurantiaca]